jgi:protein TonB
MRPIRVVLCKDRDLVTTTADGEFPSWDPPELGMGKATLGAILLVAAILGFCYFAAISLAPKPPPVVIQVTQATLTTLPKPTPPPPPKVIPPPKPIPAVIPKPPPVQSKIVVATKPPPVIHHIFKPVPHPVINHAPPPPTPLPVSPQPSAPPSPPTSGIPIYGSQMHDIIQSNQDVPPALAQLGVSGTCVVRVIVAPDGSVTSASIAKSSGIPLIDQTCLDHTRNAHLNPFNSQMPSTPQAFLIPIEIDATDSGN